MSPELQIIDRPIGRGHRVYMIAEMSANHGQDYGRATEIIHAAKAAGADAIKLQTYTPDTMTISSDRAEFQIGKGSLWEGRNLYDLYGEAYTPWDWQPKLKALAEGIGLHCFSSPFDASAVDFLETMSVPAYKIASFELVDIPLIRRVAQTGRPIIMSTGMATPAEIDDAVEAMREEGNNQIALLKCTSAYPAVPAEMHLRAIPHLAKTYGVPAGLSDHTLGVVVPVAAVAVGACIIEKHFTLSREKPGPDSAFSLEPDEFRAMVEAVRMAEEAMGNANMEITEQEKASRLFRRSLFVVENVKQGDLLNASNVRSIRPAHGLLPKHLPEVLGLRAARDLERGTPLSLDDIEAEA